MNLYNIRGGSREDLENHKYNIGVGISIGNKWFNVENILELVKWSLKYTRERVTVYVADSIHALNIEAREGKDHIRAKDVALRKGNEILDAVKERVNETLSVDEIRKIDFIHWDSLVNSLYEEKLAYLYKFFEENEEFRGAITNLVKRFIAKEKRSFSEAAIKKMCYYILEELPELIARVNVGKISYDAYIYPIDTDLNYFVEQLQKGDIFPEIRVKILDTEPKVFLEVG